MITTPQSRSLRPVLALTLLASLIPLCVTPVLPLTDFYAHIARYYILANLPDSAMLQQNYEAAWQLLPNLGLDILGTGIMKVLPPLLGAKLIAGLIIAAPFAGILYLSRVLHGQLSALTVFLAGLVAYNHILIWGFSNFLLGLGVLLGAIGFWIATQDRPIRQLAVTACLGLLLFFIHGLAFALWGLLLSMVELSLAFRSGYPGLPVLLRKAARLVSIAIAPTVVFLQTKTASGGVATPVSNLLTHAEQGTLWARLSTEAYLRVDGFLRVTESTWRTFDWGFGILLWGVLIGGLIIGRWRIDWRMKLAVALCGLLILITPPNLFGVGHLSERIPLLMLALLAASLSLNSNVRQSSQRSAVAAIAGLFLLRNLMLTVGWYQDGKIYSSYLEALNRYDTRSLGAGAYVEDAKDSWVFKPNCKPLSFLMIFSGTAVPTFANPTQQPLRIIGPLSHVNDMVHSIALSADHTVSSALSLLRNTEVDTIVVCSKKTPPKQTRGFEIVATTAPWVLYQRTVSQ
ncbi:hypothetical protein [Ruegeria sp. HKCCD6157]|uniref:hypothetical protein n=1 Tax=Ruegeria sp. HKCCD6157 TaxID=2690707 RepID=UPI0019ECD0C6|nr:hypothetical protein [Ruegeria sp. HKCCD6157]NOE28365.1 hypothetical protein [Ruegeria sp. HKCCD6157]